MLIVQKYGGTSVADPERIRNVARRVAASKKEGHDVVVVLSAMAGETNRLISLANQVAAEPDGREYDMLISSGEQVTIALLALTLRGMGIPARSFLGHQVRIVTDNAFTKARIKSIDADHIRKQLDSGEVIVVAGFQGMDEEGNITTLGRGGSDTTAVALAGALQADSCEIYTDVDGVYTADPRLVPNARKIEKISYEEMLEMASLGSKVLQSRSVEIAANYNVPVWVRSSFDHGQGTLVTKEDRSMEKVFVAGVAHDVSEAKIAVRHLADCPGIASRLFIPMTKANINVDMIIQNISKEGFTDITFTVPKTDFQKAMRLVQETAKELGAKAVEADEHIAKVSVVGVGMRSHAGVASKAFTALFEEGVNIQMISTSEIKI
ncbi:MAG: aspartate kinase, partial [bacterium]|nr:aspartate kinase [bacterium]